MRNAAICNRKCRRMVRCRACRLTHLRVWQLRHLLVVSSLGILVPAEQHGGPDAVRLVQRALAGGAQQGHGGARLCGRAAADGVEDIHKPLVVLPEHLQVRDSGTAMHWLEGSVECRTCTGVRVGTEY